MAILTHFVCLKLFCLEWELIIKLVTQYDRYDRKTFKQLIQDFVGAKVKVLYFFNYFTQ